MSQKIETEVTTNPGIEVPPEQNLTVELPTSDGLAAERKRIEAGIEDEIRARNERLEQERRLARFD